MGGTWPQGNCFPSLVEMLTSPQVLFPYMPTGSPREATQFPVHTPSALTGKPYAAMGSPEGSGESRCPRECIPDSGYSGSQRLLTMSVTSRHAKVCMTTSLLFHPRISVWLPEAKSISRALERKWNHLPKPLTSLARKCQGLLRGSAGLCRVQTMWSGQNRASGRREKIKMEEAFDHCHCPPLWLTRAPSPRPQSP